jgi:hypothetical protein
MRPAGAIAARTRFKLAFALSAARQLFNTHAILPL